MFWWLKKFRRIPPVVSFMVEGKKGWAYGTETGQGGKFLPRFLGMVDRKSGLSPAAFNALATRLNQGTASQDDHTLYAELKHWLHHSHALKLEIPIADKR